MLNFVVNKETCTKCGECAADCPARIIAMEADYPSIASDKEPACYQCQHCFCHLSHGSDFDPGPPSGR